MRARRPQMIYLFIFSAKERKRIENDICVLKNGLFSFAAEEGWWAKGDPTGANEAISLFFISIELIHIISIPRNCPRLSTASEIVFLVMIHVRGMNLRVMDARNVCARSRVRK